MPCVFCDYGNNFFSYNMVIVTYLFKVHHGVPSSKYIAILQ